MKSLFKSTTLLLLPSFLLFAVSCSKDDEADGPSYEFIDQNAQGTIDGISFSFQTGTAEDSFFNEEELSIDLYDESEDITDVCDFFGFGDAVRVFFSIPNTVGLYELSFSFDDAENGRTVTMFNPAKTLNIIATEGAVEILSISDTEVSGRLDIDAGEGNEVNGNFTVTICLQ